MKIKSVIIITLLFFLPILLFSKLITENKNNLVYSNGLTLTKEELESVGYKITAFKISQVAKVENTVSAAQIMASTQENKVMNIFNDVMIFKDSSIAEDYLNNINYPENFNMREWTLFDCNLGDNCLVRKGYNAEENSYAYILYFTREDTFVSISLYTGKEEDYDKLTGLGNILIEKINQAKQII